MVTYVIIGVTVAVSLMCFSNREWLEKLALNPYRMIHAGEWYRLITHGFVHADGTHLFVNMFTFWSFGTYIEQVFDVAGWGTGSYLLLYFGAMVVASVPDLIRYRHASWYRSIGASGAVSGILFTSIFLNPWDKILLFAVVPIPGILFGVVYLVYCQYMAKRGGDHVNHTAHFYGAVYGFVFPILMRPDLFSVFIERFKEVL